MRRWISGFAGFVNWTTNGRSILPMVVPVGILLARRLEAMHGRRVAPLMVAWPLGAAVILAVAVTWADSAFAETARTGAQEVIHKYTPAPNRPVWFQGHWGFQYYMEQLGAKPVNVQNSGLVPGDLVVVPTTNTNIYPMPREWVTVRGVIDVPGSRWLATMNSQIGAGFYADVFGHTTNVHRTLDVIWFVTVYLSRANHLSTLGKR